MDKLSFYRLQNIYYSLGDNANSGSGHAGAVTYKTASPTKDILRMIGGGVAYSLPTAGALAGAGLGGKAAIDWSKAIIDDAIARGTGSTGAEGIAEVMLALTGMGAGFGAATVGGGVLGHSAGKSARDLIRSKLYPAGRGKL